jgi:hypothetical protein
MKDDPVIGGRHIIRIYRQTEGIIQESCDIFELFELMGLDGFAGGQVGKRAEDLGVVVDATGLVGYADDALDVMTTGEELEDASGDLVVLGEDVGESEPLDAAGDGEDVEVGKVESLVEETEDVWEDAGVATEDDKVFGVLWVGPGEVGLVERLGGKLGGRAGSGSDLVVEIGGGILQRLVEGVSQTTRIRLHESPPPSDVGDEES